MLLGTGVADFGRPEKVTLTHKEIFECYMYAGAISRDPGAVAAMFTEDGVYEAPLVPDGHRLPRRLAGRDAIRAGMGAFHQELPSGGRWTPGSPGWSCTRRRTHTCSSPSSMRSWSIRWKA
jgi:hypothetical protein